jgi:outer membrane protein
VKRVFFKTPISIITIFFVVAGLSGSALAAQDLKIGYVDLQLALNSVEEGKNAQKILETNKKNKEKVIEAKKDELMKLQEELKTQSVILSENARKTKEEALLSKKLDYQKLVVEAQRELDADQMKYVNKILNKLAGIAQEIGQKEGFTLILEKNQNVLYALNSMNLTQKLIDKYNSEQTAAKK